MRNQDTQDLILNFNCTKQLEARSSEDVIPQTMYTLGTWSMKKTARTFLKGLSTSG